MTHKFFRSLAILLPIVLAAPCLAQAPVEVSPSDPNIQYVGRWNRADPASPHSNWGGAYLRARFTGTSVGVKLAGPTGLVVSIDNEAFRAVSGGAGVTPLNPSPLKSATHTVLVGSAGQNYEVSFQGLVLDGGASVVPPPDTPRPLIEFVGDSITTGTGSPAGTVNWAWSTAEALGCDHVQIAFSGLALTSGFGCLPSKIGLDKLYLLEKNYNHRDETPQVPWNFSYTPDLIVVNLGQNDQCGAEPPAVLQSSYVGFLRMLWEHFPRAEIVAVQPFSHAFADSIKSAVGTVAASGNTRVHYVDTAGWLRPDDYVDGTHPNGVGNLKVMGRLTAILRPLLPAK